MLEDTEGLYIGYRAYDRDGRTPAFPFGHGPGYTDWEFRDIEAAAVHRDGADGDVEVRVRVANIGTRAGREVVQVYASRPAGGVERRCAGSPVSRASSPIPGKEAVVRSGYRCAPGRTGTPPPPGGSWSPAASPSPQVRTAGYCRWAASSWCDGPCGRTGAAATAGWCR